MKPYLLLCLPLLGLGFSAAAHAADVSKPNILWLLAEDMGPEALSSFGTPQAKTPVIDQLGRDGVRFTRAYTTAPVCSASRSAFMTGMYATSIGAQNHRTPNKKPLPAGVATLTERLRAAGYFTSNIVSFPREVAQKGAGKTDWNFQPEGVPFEGKDWSELKAHQPFYAQVNFSETHRDYHGPAESDPAKVELPPYYPDHPVARKDWAEYLDSARELDRKVGRILTQLAADGLAENTIVVFMGDNGQSMVRGKQFCYEEGLHVPLFIRWPQGIPVPQGFVAGIDNPALVAAIDLTATTLTWAGLKPPENMQGQIFLGPAAVTRDLVFGARDRCDETAMRIRTVRDERYRYIHNFTPEMPFFSPNAYKSKQYPVWDLMQQLHKEGKLNPVQEFLCQPRMPDEELYDLISDPHEINNLVGSTKPEDQAALKKLRAAVEAWIVKTDDQGRLPETSSAPSPNPKGKGKKKAELQPEVK